LRKDISIFPHRFVGGGTPEKIIRISFQKMSPLIIVAPECDDFVASRPFSIVAVEISIAFGRTKDCRIFATPMFDSREQR
jgi:hypothetical protein